ncbi:MAG: tRNA preQ1(34) S-adenosylmethionine ribosyltransferase-isomerase QueA [Limnochordales bacterium]
MSERLRTDDFDYELPEELIAQKPVEPRDASRLMVIDKRTGQWQHRIFRDLPEFLRPGDVLVRNNTRVLPARLRGRKMPTGGSVELLLLRRESFDTWEVMVKPGRRVQPGAVLVFGDGSLTAQVLERTSEGNRIVRFRSVGPLDKVLQEVGEIPLPPYIHEKLDDPERYQTVYATKAGSAAAPTAGLHFTPELLDRLAAMGVVLCDVTLHVGPGTFRPVKTEYVEDHRMHAEYYEVPEETAAALDAARREGRRIIAVGTTSARTLEAYASTRQAKGWTDLFIYPGYQWRLVDGLLTNFHLPRSSLLMLVSALLGRERTLAAYREAVAQRYRFFSFGDAMLIL